MNNIKMTNKKLLSTAAKNNSLTVTQAFNMIRNVADLQTKILTTSEADKIAKTVKGV